MSNDEHVTKLARGAAAWNEWRANRDETPDLSRAGLSLQRRVRCELASNSNRLKEPPEMGEIEPSLERQ